VVDCGYRGGRGRRHHPGRRDCLLLLDPQQGPERRQTHRGEHQAQIRRYGLLKWQLKGYMYRCIVLVKQVCVF